MTREETSKYTCHVKDNTIRQFSFEMDARSIIISPAHPQHVGKSIGEVLFKPEKWK